MVGLAVSEKIFEIVDGRTDDGRTDERTTDGRRTDGRTDDGRTPDHGHPISSPCEPNGSGELKNDREITIVISMASRFIKQKSKNGLIS